MKEIIGFIQWTEHVPKVKQLYNSNFKFKSTFGKI